MWVSLLIILGIIAAGGSIAWFSCKTGISPMPSSKKASQAILQALEGVEPGLIVDTGSAWGTLVIAAAKKHPEHKIIGYELSPLPWLVSILRKRMGNIHNLSLHRKDFLKADLSNANTILCYLFTDGMTALEKKLQQEQNEVSLIISNNFALPSHKATKVIKLDNIYATPVYVYRW